jgi:hypothetical protein
MPIPKKIADAPSLFAGLDLFYIAFWELTTCRELGYGSIGPINWLTVHEYCKYNGIEDEQREDMFYFIGKMDEVYLEHTAARNKKKHDEAAAAAKAKGEK